MKELKKIVLNSGLIEYRLDGKRHREDGPAVEYANGSKSWWVNGKLHRTDGPAIEQADGRKEWWVGDKLHRVDGPAVIRDDGTTEYWFNDKEVSEGDFQYEVIKANEERRLADEET
jgi:hypothetical protein